MRATIERKLFQRLLTYLVIMYAMFSVDRVNISFAALQMNHALGFSPEIYGAGAGIFSVSMLLFQIPAVHALRRLGGRKGFAVALISWGLVSTITAFIWDQWSFYAVRFLLGAAEAGFAVFVVYYIHLWFPKSSRARALSISLAAVPASMAVASPLSGWILSGHEVAGLQGWQRIFLFEGLPSIFLGFITLGYLVDRPSQARWLTEEQRQWLGAELIRDHAEAQARDGASLQNARQMLRSPDIWVAAIVQFAAITGINGLVYWLPLIVKQVSGYSNLRVGFVAALPWIAMIIGMVINGRHSDKTQERLWHLVAGLLISASGFVLGASASAPWLVLLGLFIGALGAGAIQAVFWTLPLAFLSGAAAATGLAIINLIGNSSGIITPYLIGVIRTTTGSFNGALFMLAGCYVIAVGVLLLRSRHGRLMVARPAGGPAT